MTDKVQLIKEEIEREMRVLDLTNDFDNGRFSELNHLKLFIDSLPEESANDEEIEALNDVRHLNPALDSLYLKLKKL